MATTAKSSNHLHTNGSISSHFQHINDWSALFQDGKIPFILNHNSKLNSEIHSAVIQVSSEYMSTICDHLFTLYHDVKHRPFVLQFLPSFVTAYYDVLYHPSESIDAATKVACSTIDTFLVGLYNLAVTEDGLNEKIHRFRIPNLALPSIYHTPNPDHYAPTPLTQHAILKHETKYEVIRLQSFTPFDSVNGPSSNSRVLPGYYGEQILWFLFIQYGSYVSLMDKYSQRSYVRMTKKLLGQGFSFDSNAPPSNSESILPPNGRRIQVSSRIMSEILGTLLYLKSSSSNNEANDCTRLLKRRAEYEMYADVILMTESMGYLHEFETQRPEKKDSIGIDIKPASTIDIVQQKRTATTTRSIRNPRRASKTTTLNAKEIISESAQRPILNVVDGNSSTLKHLIPSPTIDQARTTIFSSIGPTASTPPSRHKRNVSLTSTKTSFKTIEPYGSSPTLQIQKTIHNADELEENRSITILPRSRSSSVRHGETKDMIATVRFSSDTADENGAYIEETYL